MLFAALGWRAREIDQGEIRYGTDPTPRFSPSPQRDGLLVAKVRRQASSPGRSSVPSPQSVVALAGTLFIRGRRDRDRPRPSGYMALIVGAAAARRRSAAAIGPRAGHRRSQVPKTVVGLFVWCCSSRTFLYASLRRLGKFLAREHRPLPIAGQSGGTLTHHPRGGPAHCTPSRRRRRWLSTTRRDFALTRGTRRDHFTIPTAPNTQRTSRRAPRTRAPHDPFPDRVAIAVVLGVVSPAPSAPSQPMRARIEGHPMTGTRAHCSFRRRTRKVSSPDSALWPTAYDRSRVPSAPNIALIFETMPASPSF